MKIDFFVKEQEIKDKIEEYLKLLKKYMMKKRL
jgi:hypothetical protein